MNIKPKKQLRYSFLLGFLSAMFSVSMIQDMYGKHEYIRLVKSNWMDTHWLMWFVLLCLALSLYHALRNRIKDTD